ncbi:hypothetical protein T439DRAFT_328966 [Meredithblackwellia eburnea MCA 4105]
MAVIPSGGEWVRTIGNTHGGINFTCPDGTTKENQWSYKPMPGMNNAPVTLGAWCRTTVVFTGTQGWFTSAQGPGAGLYGCSLDGSIDRVWHWFSAEKSDAVYGSIGCHWTGLGNTSHVAVMINNPAGGTQLWVQSFSYSPSGIDKLTGPDYAFMATKSNVETSYTVPPNEAMPTSNGKAIQSSSSSSSKNKSQSSSGDNASSNNSPPTSESTSAPSTSTVLVVSNSVPSAASGSPTNPAPVGTEASAITSSSSTSSTATDLATSAPDLAPATSNPFSGINSTYWIIGLVSLFLLLIFGVFVCYLAFSSKKKHLTSEEEGVTRALGKGGWQIRRGSTREKDTTDSDSSELEDQQVRALLTSRRNKP